jgi:hypothetical protein
VHAIDIWCLALHIDGTHIDTAGKADARARRSGCNAVLACAGFGDDAFRTKSLRE